MKEKKKKKKNTREPKGITLRAERSGCHPTRKGRDTDVFRMQKFCVGVWGPVCNRKDVRVYHHWSKEGFLSYHGVWGEGSLFIKGIRSKKGGHHWYPKAIQRVIKGFAKSNLSYFPYRNQDWRRKWWNVEVKTG